MVVVFAAVCGCEGDLGPRPTRIVLVTLDTLRLDSFSGSTTRESAMPKTLAFARKGRIFANYFSATPTTQPSHASLLTGLHPWEHGVTKNGLVLYPEHSTVAEVLGARGYSTAAVVASFPLKRQFGFDQGFESYDDAFTLDIVGRQWEGRPLGNERFYSLSKRVTDQAIERLDLADGPLQFFWFHYFDSHDPYGDTAGPVVQLTDLLELVAKRSPELPELLASAREGYDRDNAFLDKELDRLFRRLAADSELFETHIVLASDHGEAFGEAQVFGHGRFLTPELIHVPMFIVSPRIDPGVDRASAGSVDVAATLVGLADVGEPFGVGRDLIDSAAWGGNETPRGGDRGV
jgi:arylsulfatase A-like enzyme